VSLPPQKSEHLPCYDYGPDGEKKCYDITLPSNSICSKISWKICQVFQVCRRQLCALLCSLRARLQLFFFPPNILTTKIVSFSLPLRRFARNVIFEKKKIKFADSRWPRGLRHGTAVARLLGLRVRILPVAWMFVVSVVCCQIEVTATGRSLVQRSPTERVGVSERDQMRN